MMLLSHYRATVPLKHLSVSRALWTFFKQTRLSWTIGSHARFSPLLQARGVSYRQAYRNISYL
jgi:hypothetical protein